MHRRAHGTLTLHHLLSSLSVPVQERLTAGYYSLADKVRESLVMNVSVAPAGLAWQQVFRMSLGKAADELPEGQ
jgi:hypothetical protein